MATGDGGDKRQAGKSASQEFFGAGFTPCKSQTCAPTLSFRPPEGFQLVWDEWCLLPFSTIICGFVVAAYPKVMQPSPAQLPWPGGMVTPLPHRAEIASPSPIQDGNSWERLRVGKPGNSFGDTRAPFPAGWGNVLLGGEVTIPAGTWLFRSPGYELRGAVFAQGRGGAFSISPILPKGQDAS